MTLWRPAKPRRGATYQLLALFKFVTQRAEDKRLEPWRKLMERIKEVLKWGSDEIVSGFRPRSFAVPTALA